MTTEQKIPANIEDEIRSSYLDYAMSVIVGRALPDARDGLKPVHRRILYTMHDAGHQFNRPFVKSARVVGDVMGKLHPHGDAAIYDSLARMAQNFSMRYRLADGQGNFGSVDGDPPAAMRYTEVRLMRLASEILGDIEKETVDWRPSYDEKQLEPVVLPAKLPLLLLNGSEGIAVGMATKIPPHNLRELLDALVALAGSPELTIADLMEFVPGPDFPTGGFIYGRQGIFDAYSTGRGRILMRARLRTEEHERTHRESIVITEIPYQVNKARLLEEIAGAVRDKRIEGIADLRDESDKDGMRIVIDLKRDAVDSVIINQLYKLTNCSATFGIIMLALVGDQPRVLNLKELLQEFLNFRREVVTRRCLFEKREAEARAHVLEGLIIALDNIDAVITTIRSSKTLEEARGKLISGFALSQRQAQAILDMRLARLTGLEREKIDAEYDELSKKIAYLAEILADQALLMQVIVDELKTLREQYGDDRRTEIVDEEGRFTVEDLIVEEDMVVTISRDGYIKRNPLSLYRAQRRGGKGVIGMETKDDDFVEQLYVASTHHFILVFTNHGKLYWLKVYQIPQVGRAGRGKAIVNLLNLGGDEKVVTILPIREFTSDRFIVMVSRKGKIKKTPLMAFSNVRSNGIIALSIDKGDDLVFVGLSDGTQNILVATSKGMAIRFDGAQIRPMGRTARGVKAITLDKDDDVVAAMVMRPGISILTICEWGFGKRTPEEDYRCQSRGGKGVITIRTTGRNGRVVGFRQVDDDDQLMMITENGKIIRMGVRSLRLVGRNTQGVRLFGMSEGDRVVSVYRIPQTRETEDIPDEDENSVGDEGTNGDVEPGDGADGKKNNNN